MMIDDRLVAMAARCARRERVKKVEAAVMMREAWDEIRLLRADLALAIALLREAREEYVDDDDLASRIDALLARFPEANP